MQGDEGGTLIPMEAFIALVVLLGVLVLGSDQRDPTSASTTDERSDSTALVADDAHGPSVCDEVGPHHRDLTIPYEHQGRVAASIPGNCPDD